MTDQVRRRPIRDDPPITRRTALAGTAALTVITACRAAAPDARGGRRAETRARADLYHCEGCDGVLERSHVNLGWNIEMARGEHGSPLIVEGRTLKPDGATAAPGTILYIYHTNADGLYAHGSTESEWSRRHGRIRGWLKTDAQGRYRIRTIKPAPYPGESYPAHLHFTILEPGKRPYYIDDIVFEGEFGVTPAYRGRQEFRGGSGIGRLITAPDGTPLARRDIILERHP